MSYWMERRFWPAIASSAPWSRKPKIDRFAEASSSRKARSASPYRSSVNIPSSIRGTRLSSLAFVSVKGLADRMVTCSFVNGRVSTVGVAIGYLQMMRGGISRAIKRLLPSPEDLLHARRETEERAILAFWPVELEADREVMTVKADRQTEPG